MKVAISGSHGLIGSALIRSLEADGHRFTRLPRVVVDVATMEGHDAVVNLAGAGIGDHRWTDSYKAEILDSRVKGTTALAGAIASLDRPPSVMASASAVGYYGDRGDTQLTESSGPGTGFASEVVQQWEAATAPASDAGIRVVNMRSGIVMSGEGGALKKQLLPFKLGLGGRLGSGRQYLSWIAIDDEIAAIRHVLSNESIIGPVNLTAPNPVTNAEFTKTLGRALRRPTLVPIPIPALWVLFGKELVNEMMGGQRVLPAVLRAHGFEFKYPTLAEALRAAVVRS